jgi:glycosyltransferase involved in cell wall biosynthesis
VSGRSGGLFLGRLATDAGIDLLARALELFPGARVAHLPAGVSRRELRGRMQRAAYLVVPSLRDDVEPQPLVMAFAEGLPVIASRIARLEELVEPGRNGLLFEPDSPRELARRLAWAEAFPERMRQMGECAQADYQARFVAHWDWQRLYGERRRQARLHS